MRYNEIFGLRFFDVVEKKEPEIAVREMGGGSYSDEKDKGWALVW